MNNKNESEVLTKVKYEDLMETNSADYFYSVITDRAIADIRDGLKPVQRRILYTGLTGHYDSSKPFKKAAKIVSDTMNYFHPHADASLYDSAVRLSQDFTQNVILLEAHGK